MSFSSLCSLTFATIGKILKRLLYQSSRPNIAPTFSEATFLFSNACLLCPLPRAQFITHATNCASCFPRPLARALSLTPASCAYFFTPGISRPCPFTRVRWLVPNPSTAPTECVTFSVLTHSRASPAFSGHFLSTLLLASYSLRA